VQIPVPFHNLLSMNDPIRVGGCVEERAALSPLVSNRMLWIITSTKDQIV